MDGHTVLYSIQLFFVMIGVVSNLIACVVIVSNKKMHTVTNCYLFSLSISDLIILMYGTSFTAQKLFPGVVQSAIYLGFPYTYIIIVTLKTAQYMSITTIVSFAITRYLAICYPFYTQRTSEVGRTVKQLLMFWLLFFLSELPMELDILLKNVEWTDIVSPALLRSLIYLRHGLFLVLPFNIVIILYVLIGIRISKRNEAIDNKSNSGVNAAQKSNLMMIGTIFITTLICWTPRLTLTLFNMFYMKGDPTNIPMDALKYVFIAIKISDCLFLLSPILNSFIYSIMSDKFRKSLKEVINKLCGARPIHKKSSTTCQSNDKLIRTKFMTNV